MPLGPPNLWALSDIRSTCGHSWRRSSQHAACTASLWSNAPGASARIFVATAAMSLTDPTSLLTAMTETIDTLPSRPAAS